MANSDVSSALKDETSFVNDENLSPNIVLDEYLLSKIQNEADWKTQDIALTDIQRIIKSNPTSLNDVFANKPAMDTVVDATIAIIQSLRSAPSKNAMLTICSLSNPNTRNAFITTLLPVNSPPPSQSHSPLSKGAHKALHLSKSSSIRIKNLLNNLLNKACSTAEKKFIQVAAEETLKCVAALPRITEYLLTELLICIKDSSRNSLKLSKAAVVMLSAWRSEAKRMSSIAHLDPELVSHSETLMSLIAQAIPTLINDKLSTTRQSAREILTEMQSFADQFDASRVASSQENSGSLSHGGSKSAASLRTILRNVLQITSNNITSPSMRMNFASATKAPQATQGAFLRRCASSLKTSEKLPSDPPVPRKIESWTRPIDSSATNDPPVSRLRKIESWNRPLDSSSSSRAATIKSVSRAPTENSLWDERTTTTTTTAADGKVQSGFTDYSHCTEGAEEQEDAKSVSATKVSARSVQSAAETRNDVTRDLSFGFSSDSHGPRSRTRDQTFTRSSAAPDPFIGRPPSSRQGRVASTCRFGPSTSREQSLVRGGKRETEKLTISERLASTERVGRSEKLASTERVGSTERLARSATVLSKSMTLTSSQLSASAGGSFDLSQSLFTIPPQRTDSSASKRGGSKAPFARLPPSARHGGSCSDQRGSFSSSSQYKAAPVSSSRSACSGRRAPAGGGDEAIFLSGARKSSAEKGVSRAAIRSRSVVNNGCRRGVSGAVPNVGSAKSEFRTRSQSLTRRTSLARMASPQAMTRTLPDWLRCEEDDEQEIEEFEKRFGVFAGGESEHTKRERKSR